MIWQLLVPLAALGAVLAFLAWPPAEACPSRSDAIPERQPLPNGREPNRPGKG